MTDRDDSLDLNAANAREPASAAGVPHLPQHREIPRRHAHAADWLIARVAALAFAATVVLAGLFTLQRFADHDVFWHVRTGEWILQTRQIPRTDPFGSMTADLPWLDVAWGAQVAAAAVASQAGLAGVQILVAALLMGTLAVHGFRTPLSPDLLIATLLVTLTCWPRFLVRPDILVFPLTLAALWILEPPARPGRTAALLGLLAAVWANLHGSFILPALLAGACLCGSLAIRREADLVRADLCALLAALAAPLVNPYGWRLYTLLGPYARSLLAAGGLLPHSAGLVVSEWRPTWRLIGSNQVFPTLPFLLLAALLALSFAGLPWRRTARRLACAAALALLALTAVRNLLPFAAGALGLILANKRDRHRSGALRTPGLLMGASLAVLAAACWNIGSVLTDRFYVQRDVPNLTGVGPYLDLEPEGAVRWLAEHRFPGRMFNNYNSGAYLLYRLSPQVRTYIDPRLDTTPLYQEIGRAIHDPEAFEDLAARDGIRTVVLVHPSPESALMLPWLSADPRWMLAFRDAVSTIHVRAADTPVPPRDPPLRLRPADEALAVRINGWLEPLKRFRLPARDLTDGFVSGILGDREGQIAAYRRALELAPYNERASSALRQLRNEAEKP